MTGTIIRLADCPPQPWKNGLGRTREIAVHPSGAGIDDFRWRASLAEVDSAADFSRFPGIDRQIVLLEGAGFTMRLDDTRTHALTTPFEPFAFAGEAAVTIALAGPSRDFNLMLRRDRVCGRVEVLRDARMHALPADLALLFCARGSIALDDAILHPGDAWRVDPSRPMPSFLPRAGSVALAVRIVARPPDWSTEGLD